MPLLTRMIGAPLFVDIGPGTVAQLAPLLADRRISAGGHVAVVVGPGLGEEIAEQLRPQLENADFWTLADGGVDEANALAKRLRAGFYDALVGIGGGRTLDVSKLASTLSGLPMVAVATSLAHDGIASPVASLEEGGRKGSYGVQMPIALVVDLDYVRRSDPGMRRSGIGDVVSNLSAIADWRLAGRERGEPVDGLAVTFAQTAAKAILHRDGRDRRRGLPRRARRGARAVGPRDDDGRLEPAVQRRPTTRSCTRSTTSTPTRRATASWPAPRRCSRRSCAATRRWRPPSTRA